MEMEPSPTGDPRTDVNLAHEMAHEEKGPREQLMGRLKAAAEIGLSAESLSKISAKGESEIDQATEARRQEVLAARQKAEELLTILFQSPDLKMPEQPFEPTRDRDQRSHSYDVIGEISSRVNDFDPEKKKSVPKVFDLASYGRVRNPDMIIDFMIDNHDDGTQGWHFGAVPAPHEEPKAESGVRGLQEE